MTTDPHDSQEFTPEETMLALFETLPFREKVRKVYYGLRQPKHTGDYKYARLQVQRLWSPIMAVVVPCLMLLTIMLLGAAPDSAPDRDWWIRDEDPEPVTQLDPVEPPDDVLLLSDDDFVVDISDNTPVPSEPPAPVSGPIAQVPTLAPVARIKSPVYLRGFYTTRQPGARPGVGNGTGGGSSTGSAVLRALRWLKKHQQPDGSWVAESGGRQSGGRHNTGAAPAMTGLGLLTFLAHGETPMSDEFGETVTQAIRWLVDNQEADGRFRGRDAHNYSHPIAAYALCEAFGMTRIPVVRTAAERSIAVIINGQHSSGGWDYNCRESDRNDLSYGGWCVQALKAAHIAGLRNQGLREALKRAVDGIRLHAHPEGGFGYTSRGQSHLTSVGVLCLQMLRAGDTPDARRGLAWLERATCDWHQPWGRSPLYYWYYVTQAKYRAGSSEWEKWNRQFVPVFCRNQTVLAGAGPDGHDIGYWASPAATEHCRSLVYNTTLCALTLQVVQRSGPSLKTYDIDAPDNGDDGFEDPSDVPTDIEVVIVPQRERTA